MRHRGNSLSQNSLFDSFNKQNVPGRRTHTAKF